VLTVRGTSMFFCDTPYYAATYYKGYHKQFVWVKNYRKIIKCLLRMPGADKIAILFNESMA